MTVTPALKVAERGILAAFDVVEFPFVLSAYLLVVALFLAEVALLTFLLLGTCRVGSVLHHSFHRSSGFSDH